MKAFIINKKTKYHNKITLVGHDKFDSKKEAKRYGELLLLERAGLISNIEKQPKFKLLDSRKWNGKTLKSRSYTADFQYIENGNTVVEDVKGFETDVYKLKRHLFLSLYKDIEFRET